jgi:hypothetical protein
MGVKVEGRSVVAFRIPQGISGVISAAALVFASAATTVATPVTHGDGTYRLMQRLHQMHLQGKSGFAASTASTGLTSGRVYLTAHIAVHYTLAPTIHRPTFTSADSAFFLPKIDSILAALPAFVTAYQRDSMVNAAFPDTIDAPVFVQRAGVYFERAWSYYQDTLGMDMPPGGANSYVFGSLFGNGDGDRYTVDVCDIGTADPDDAAGQAIYGLTIPQPTSTLLENDFIYSAAVKPSGQIVGGDTIKAIVNNQVLHDYSVDWDMGIKVTAAHEFSHAVHFNYTNGINTDGFHDWYELSATAMEEILAPEVNDYFQYLPCIFQKHQSVPLIDSTHDGSTVDNGICEVAPYNIESFFGQGVFAQYLYRFVDKKFDAALWANLRSNGNILPAALKTTMAQYGKNWDSVYAAYTAIFATAGRPGFAASCTDSVASIFTRDLPCWPVPSFDATPGIDTPLFNVIPPLTFRLFKPSATPFTSTQINLNNLSEGIPEEILLTGSNYSANPLAGNPVPFLASPTGSIFGLTVPNASFNQSGSVLESTKPQGFAAFPNPVSPSNGVVFFFAPSDSATVLPLTIVSESGRRVAVLVPASDGVSWSWDFRDEQGRSVPPGVYYYGIPGQPVKSLLVLTH